MVLFIEQGKLIRFGGRNVFFFGCRIPYIRYDALRVLILTNTAIECVSRQVHSSHKVPARDVIGFPFPIEFAKFLPINRDRLSPCVPALCLSNLYALTLSLLYLLTPNYDRAARTVSINFPVGVSVSMFSL